MTRLRAEHLGMVFQDALLDRSRTVIDIVTEPSLYCSHRGDLRPTARTLLQGLGVGHLERRRPGQISGGQAQRIGVARALVTRPAVILADEPSGNLDDEAAQAVIAALLEHVRREHAVLLIATHDPRMTSLCDERVELG